MASQVFEFDLTSFRRGIFRLGDGYKAMRETLRSSGMGETSVSMRKKEWYEKKKARHGREIAWFFRERLGKDLFETEGRDFDDIVDRMAERFQDAVIEAYEDEDPKTEKVKQLLLQAAQEWAEVAQDRLEAGYLGANGKRASAVKKALVKAGVISSEHGDPPPRGIRSGRFLRGIVGKWRLGRVQDADSFEVR